MYSRAIDGNVLTLAASGWTYRDTFVLYDRETGSLWYHFGTDNHLTCIGGPYRDRTLPERQSYRLRWNRWVQDHPDSKLMECIKVELGACRQE